jgi:hypothetical protein
MKTEINNWLILDVYQDEDLTVFFGKAIAGIATNSNGGRFEVGERVCTASIENVCMMKKRVTTKFGEEFKLKGNGQFIEITMDDFDQYNSTGYCSKFYKNHVSINALPIEIKAELLNLFQGDEQIVSEWLSNAKISQNGKAPFQLLGTNEGVGQVIDMLERIKTGDFS